MIIDGRGRSIEGIEITLNKGDKIFGLEMMNCFIDDDEVDGVSFINCALIGCTIKSQKEAEINLNKGK
jgi:hypothetical protein